VVVEFTSVYAFLVKLNKYDELIYSKVSFYVLS